MLKLTMCMGSVARCMEKFVLLHNWSNEINIAQLSLKYGTMKLQVQSIRPLASSFFKIPYSLWISVPLADFFIKIRIISKIRINTDFSVHLATLLIVYHVPASTSYLSLKPNNEPSVFKLAVSNIKWRNLSMNGDLPLSFRM